MYIHRGKVDGWIGQCLLQLTHITKMWRCASLLKSGKSCRVVTTSSNISLVHCNQTGRISSILMRICNQGVLDLSNQRSIVDKIMIHNRLMLQKHCPIGCHPRHPIGLWHWLSSSLLMLLKQISNPIIRWDIRWGIQIPSANATEARLNRIWKNHISILTKFKVTLSCWFFQSYSVVITHRHCWQSARRLQTFEFKCLWKLFYILQGA